MNTQARTIAKTTKLRDRAIRYVRQRKGNLPALSRETGLDYNWLRKFADGLIVDPGVNKIETLLTHEEKGV